MEGNKTTERRKGTGKRNKTKKRNAIERGAKKKRKREESRENMKLEQDQHYGPQRPKHPTVSTSGTQDRRDTKVVTAGHRSSV